MCYYAIQITASQLLEKPRNASASVTLSCNWKFAAISGYISEMVQASTKVTTLKSCALCDLSYGVMSSDLERP